MNIKINRRRLLITATGLTAFVAAGMVATTASAGHSSHKIPVNAHYESPPDTFTVAAPCTVDNYIPVTGLCHGAESGTAAITGSWVGAAFYDFGWVVDPAANSHNTGLSTITATVPGCGTGRFTYRFDGASDATGVGDLTWEIVPSLGTGDLAGLTGHGTEHVVQNADYTGHGDIVGIVQCAHGQPHDHN
jgi:hypothetical protein